MVHTASAASLLHAAIQDIVAAKRLQVERLPGLARAAGEALAPLIEAEAALAARQAERLAATGLDAGGPANLWMAGVLDDAERDAGAHQAGRLRDIALVGAIRKGKAAEIAADDTALALASATGLDAIGAAVAANRAEEQDSDTRLKRLLHRLT